jgi:uncharacterized protein YjiS (DUF1127 family)
MVLQMRTNDFLRLRCAAGSWIEVLSGRVWVTEDGSRRDALLGPGRRYRVNGDGLVLVGAETPAEAALLPPRAPGLRARLRDACAAWIAAWATERELEDLSDHALRDIGLRRDQIVEASRRRIPF